jgi:hypothetical protein
MTWAEVQKLMEEMGGRDDVRVEVIEMPSQPNPKWEESKDPRVREIIRLAEELRLEIREKSSYGGDGEMAALMMGLGMGMTVIQMKGAHIGCLKEMGEAFLEHLKDERGSILKFIQSLSGGAPSTPKGEGDDINWEGVIDEIGG